MKESLMRSCGIHRIGGIVLAAGGSTRMGRAKQMLTYEGKTFLRRAVEAAQGAELSPVVAVLGEDVGGVMRGEVEGLLVRVMNNEKWRGGMGTSVRVGMEALMAFGSLRGVMLMVCDQPLVTGAELRRVVEVFSRRGSGVVAAGYGGTAGVPALFGPEYFAELSRLKDGQGAKGILRREGSGVRVVAMEAAGKDVDDAAAYAGLIGVVAREEEGKRKMGMAADGRG